MNGVLLAVGFALALGACAGGESAAPVAPPKQTQSAPPGPSEAGASGGEACGSVTVPGHEALDIRATGAGCDAAKRIAAAAEGRGRAPYESGGFACEPSEAGDGDTNYRCSMESARITFRYGTT